jgi:formyltetrahydrofolate synthetase
MVEPITLATSFASIIGLFANYKAENRSKSDDEYRDFMEWLEKGNHGELIKGIEENQKLGISIKVLLNEHSDDMIEKLAQLDAALAKVASQFEGFSEIARSVHPSVELSEQALSIVKQFVASGAKKVAELIVHTGNQNVYQFLGTVQGSNKLEFSEPLFIEDDFNSLVKSNILRLEHTPKGTKHYCITRAATNLVSDALL